jgi:tyrosine-protein phosphatase SIW14
VPQPLPATKAPEVIEDVESIFPPSAFGIVEDKVFRCNAFEPANFSFVELLELKSVIYLSPEIPHRALKEFLSLHNVQFVSVVFISWLF